MGNSHSGTCVKMKACVREGIWSSMAFKSSWPAPSSLLETTEEGKYNEKSSISPMQSGIVLVKIKAAAINPVDYKLGKLILGKIVGLDFSGVVIRTCENSKFNVGDKVFGTGNGTLAEFIEVECNRIAAMPSSTTFAEAASMPIVYLTGFQGLRDNGFQSFHKILVIGSSGGCGLAALQFARALGAKEIVGICSGVNKELCLANGATRIIDYTNEDFTTVYSEPFFDIVYDAATHVCGNESYYEAARSVLVKGGKLVMLNASADKWIRKFSNFQKENIDLVVTKASGEDLEHIAHMVDGTTSAAVASTVVENTFQFPPTTELAFDKRLKPVIYKILPFTIEGIDEGFKLLKSRRAKGKIVFDVEATQK